MQAYPAGPQSSLQLGGAAEPYYGYANGFCKEFASICEFRTDNPRVIALTNDRWEAIAEVNAFVNKTYPQVADKILYGVEEKWTYPVAGKGGDCEDLALEKQRLLVEKGFPRSALLIEGVYDPQNESHAVLLVRTTKGDFILDNLVTLIRSAKELEEAGYRHVKVMDPTDFGKFRAVAGVSSPAGDVASASVPPEHPAP